MPKHIRKLFVRGEPTSGRLQIQPLDLAMLRDIAEYRLMNSEQLGALHHRGLRNFQRRLADLYHEGYLERVTGVEPVTSPWKGDVIPLYHTRDATNH